MKNILKNGFFALLALGAMAACSPQEKDDYSLGTIVVPAANQLVIDEQRNPDTLNIVTFANLTALKDPAQTFWDLGNGVKATGTKVEGRYAQKGTYTVTMTLQFGNGAEVSATKEIAIAADNFSVIATKVNTQLAGNLGGTGKTWVFDQHNIFTKQVATAVDKIAGHIGLGPLNSYSQEWWGAAPDDKKSWSMYSSTFTFNLDGMTVNIANADGKGYGRNDLAASPGGFSNVVKDGDDASFDYTGGNYTFSTAKGEKYPTLTLSGNAFMGFYAGTQTYDIIFQNDSVMALRVANTAQSQDWVFIYCLKELNERPKSPKAQPLYDDFESLAPRIPFVPKSLGDRYSTSFANPKDTSANRSLKVLRYDKSDDSTCSVSFTVDYAFDLTNVNKVRMLVYAPSANKYADGLTQDIVVKLENSRDETIKWSAPVQTISQTDTWLPITFDLQPAPSGVVYDRIVIQFGGETKIPGTFYFDNFSFDQ